MTDTADTTDTDVQTADAVHCTICDSMADLLAAGVYRCQANPFHIGDRFVGIFTDLTLPGSSKGSGESAR